MPFPFPDVLRTESGFSEAREYWRGLVDSVAVQHPGAGVWLDWLEQRYADGSPFDLEFRDVLIARSSVLPRSIRIRQTSEGGGAIMPGWWFTEYRGFEGIPDGVVELTLHVFLSNAAADAVRSILGEWFDPTSSQESVNAIAAALGEA